MLKVKIFLLLVALKNLCCPCHKDKVRGEFSVSPRNHKIVLAGKMNLLINESSGLSLSQDTGYFYTINDGGGGAEVFQINDRGGLYKSIQVPNTSNADWEEITNDQKGNIYIGDFGNNGNNRKDLKIYRYSLYHQRTDTIVFSYPDQWLFPPAKKQRNFDCEAFIFYKDSLYLFSKNRGNKMVHMYQLPAQAGKFVAKLKQRFYLNSMVTAAAVSNNHQEITLLSYGKIYFFNIAQEDTFRLKPFYCKRIAGIGQSEGILYKNQHTLYISNEQGKLYQLQLSNKDGKSIKALD